MAMAAVLENFALHSFSFEASETQVGDISGIAFAKSLHSSASLRRFSFVGNFCNVSEETCRAMGEAVGSTCLTAFEFSALHLFVSERTSICLRNALQRNNSLESIKFQTCQLDGDRAYTAVQEAVGKAIFKRGQRRCEHQPGCPCFQLSSDMYLGLSLQCLMLEFFVLFYRLGHMCAKCRNCSDPFWPLLARHN